MCYHISQRKIDRERIKERFEATIDIDDIIIPNYYHLDGFDRGQVMVITEDDPELIQFATWSMANPEQDYNIEGYWKYVGGGALNTRIEHLFSEKTKAWKKDAMLNNKCVIIVDGLFKTHELPEGKFPRYFTREEDDLFAVLGYYVDIGGVLYCSIFTMDSDDYFSEYHDRMPLTITPEEIYYYLELPNVEDIEHEVKNFRSIELQSHLVSKDIWSKKKEINSNRPDIIEPYHYPELQQKGLFD